MNSNPEHEQLIEVLRSGPRRYHIHLTGYGGEIVVGSITAAQYEFWHNREDLDEWAWDSDADITVPESMAMFPAGEYYMCDDLAHENAVEFSDSCWVTVYDEDDQEVWSSPLDEDGLSANGVDVTGMHRGEFYVADDCPTVTHAFLAQNTEKGTFWTGEIETFGDFDPNRLSFSTIDIEGWELVDGVSYESVILDDTGGYSTTGKGSDYRVFKVRDDHD
jgi:hypothetical protein